MERRSESALPKRYATWTIENVFYKLMPVEGQGIPVVDAALVQGAKLKDRKLI